MLFDNSANLIVRMQLCNDIVVGIHFYSIIKWTIIATSDKRFALTVNAYQT